MGGEEEKSALMLYGYSAFFLKCYNTHGKADLTPEVLLFLSQRRVLSTPHIRSLEKPASLCGRLLSSLASLGGSPRVQRSSEAPPWTRLHLLLRTV